MNYGSNFNKFYCMKWATMKLCFVQLELCFIGCKFHGTMSSWNNALVSMKFKTYNHEKETYDQEKWY
jgi:hypothetical protein